MEYKQSCNFELVKPDGTRLSWINTPCFAGVGSAIEHNKATHLIYYPLFTPGSATFSLYLKDFIEVATWNYEFLQETVFGKFFTQPFTEAVTNGIRFDLGETPLAVIVNACSALRHAHEKSHIVEAQKKLKELLPEASHNAILYVASGVMLTHQGWRTDHSEGHRMLSGARLSLRGFENFCSKKYLGYHARAGGSRTSYYGRHKWYSDEPEAVDALMEKLKIGKKLRRLSPFERYMPSSRGLHGVHLQPDQLKELLAKLTRIDYDQRKAEG